MAAARKTTTRKKSGRKRTRRSLGPRFEALRRRLLAVLAVATGVVGAWWALNVPGLWVESMGVPVQSVRLGPPEVGVESAGVTELGDGAVESQAPVPDERTGTRTSEAGRVVQVAASPRRDWADRLAAELRSEGYESYVSDDRAAEPRLRYKVGVRPADGESVEQLAARLRRSGRSGWIRSR